MVVNSVTRAALLLNGTVGVGKTTTADAIGDLLEARGVSGAVVDLDRLGHCWPAPDGDPFRFELMLRNLRAVVHNFVAAGAARVILAGVVETRPDRARIAEALDLPLQLCLLELDVALIRRRLVDRHRLDSAGLAWHLDRAGVLQDLLRQAAVDDFTVDMTGLDASAAADAVLRAARWV
jgi:predicted kinase